MDPFAHTFTGAALAVSGLKRKTPLATPVLLMGANAPDIDVVFAFAEDFQQLELRRGITHGVLALAILPFVVTAIALLWDRFVRRARAPDLEPARARPLLLLAALATLTHPALDWLNNYGMRWLMPFDTRWSYGDAVFIIDPWIWLAVGGIAFLAYSRRPTAFAAWCVFWALASLLVVVMPGVPLIARWLWLVGIAVLFTLRSSRLTGLRGERPFERAAQAALAAVALYVTTLALLDFAERAAVRAELAARDFRAVGDVMVAPVPANPFAGEVAIATADAYHVGTWHWLSEPHLELEAEAIPRRMTDPIVSAAAQTVEARRYLTWARFPYAKIETEDSGHVVRWLDARYHRTGQLSGPVVRLDRNLRPLNE